MGNCDPCGSEPLGYVHMWLSSDRFRAKTHQQVIYISVRNSSAQMYIYSNLKKLCPHKISAIATSRSKKKCDPKRRLLLILWRVAAQDRFLSPTSQQQVLVLSEQKHPIVQMIVSDKYDQSSSRTRFSSVCLEGSCRMCRRCTPRLGALGVKKRCSTQVSKSGPFPRWHCQHECLL